MFQRNLIYRYRFEFHTIFKCHRLLFFIWFFFFQTCFSLLAVQKHTVGWIWPRSLYYLPITSVANYHKAGGLKQQYPPTVLEARSWTWVSRCCCCTSFWVLRKSLFLNSFVFVKLQMFTPISLLFPAPSRSLMWSSWSSYQQVQVYSKGLLLVMTMVCFWGFPGDTL